ncbi:hypothetical protein [Fodinibius sediminis]|uniref:Uncharacterized protein n=1 Tax=Fodinibius sediminis TaxID=1214077 RepID=A0A521CJM2_9BACT|nr:hypothetical protein [Fodinibius sediminis]SMO59638.1 hypothetical protein SAMN06265218_106130 [Fodinibius sediminis]
MSLNQSINQIAPHQIVAPRIKRQKAHRVPFSPHLNESDKKFTAEEEAKQQEEADAFGVETDENKESETGEAPEIFLLIANPDFRELGMLGAGDQDQFLTIIIKNARQQRGVTSQLPISRKQRDHNQITDERAYQHTNRYFRNPSGEEFQGRM